MTSSLCTISIRLRFHQRTGRFSHSACRLSQVGCSPSNSGHRFQRLAYLISVLRKGCARCRRGIPCGCPGQAQDLPLRGTIISENRHQRGGRNRRFAPTQATMGFVRRSKKLSQNTPRCHCEERSNAAISQDNALTTRLPRSLRSLAMTTSF